MKIDKVRIFNFRRLRDCEILFGDKETIFVGANNSGKTSAMYCLDKFIADADFGFHDLSVGVLKKLNKVGKRWLDENFERDPETDIDDFSKLMPTLDVYFKVGDNELQYVFNLLPSLSWEGGTVAVRTVLLPRNIEELVLRFKEKFQKARKEEKKLTKEEGTASQNEVVNILEPHDFTSFLRSENFRNLFVPQSFVIDPNSGNIPLGSEALAHECKKSFQLAELVKVHFISAQRGLGEETATAKPTSRLTRQLIDYFENYLNDSDELAEEDIGLIEKTKSARKAFDLKLKKKFSDPIQKLNLTGYPGVSDPNLTIHSEISIIDSISHPAAVTYQVEGEGEFEIPEHQIGLGYQNLISIFFKLLAFNENWQKGKDRRESPEAIEPIHLVMLEEPEAHLHVQVQQVFIKHAFKILSSEKDFTTQLLISTHSPHIIKNVSLANIRYFRKTFSQAPKLEGKLDLQQNNNCHIAETKVVNVVEEIFSDVEASDKTKTRDEALRFVNKYLGLGHYDLFFADAVILVEGSVEEMLFPSFIDKFDGDLRFKYITILKIGGAYFHKLKGLLKTLQIPTVIITDLDPKNKCQEDDATNKHVPPTKKSGQITTNQCLKHFFGTSSIDELLEKKAEDKDLTEKEEFPLRIAFQLPVSNDKYFQEPIYCRTFEDSFILTNIAHLQEIQDQEQDSEIHKVCTVLSEVLKDNKHNKIDSSVHEELLKVIYSSSFKSNFACSLLELESFEAWHTPNYIWEGLNWLDSALRKGDNNER